jgi:PPK2 family polyphosphate:nucleotide phosphotransferase
MIHKAEVEAVPQSTWAQGEPIELDPRRGLVVEPGSRVALGEINPSLPCDSYECAVTLIGSYVEEISRLQYVMHAEGKHSLLIVLQGIDAAGKDSVARHILRSMNPAGCKAIAFRQPTAIELRHDFLWRIHAHAPSKGEVAVFNRSHYEDVLSARVHHTVPPFVWIRRYALITEFERLLAEANETTVLKFFLHISKAEQLARFKSRLDDPSRQWKISEADYAEREHWDAYMAAFEDMLHRTSTLHAPWYLIPANDRLSRDLAISQVIARTLQDLNMKIPEPTVDIGRIRQRYHAAQAYEMQTFREAGSCPPQVSGDVPSPQK